MKNKQLFVAKRLGVVLTGLYGERFPTFPQVFNKYLTVLQRWEDTRGTRSMVLRAKSVYHSCLCAMLGQPDPEYPFMATSKGWPRVANGFKSIARQGPEGKRAVLSALSIYRVMAAPGKPDFTPITRDGVPVSPELTNELSKWVKPTEISRTPEYQLRSKSGPNGQAVLTAHLDAQGLAANPEINRACHWLLKKQSGETVSKDLELLQQTLGPRSDLKISKLSVKRELGGKDRIFAICDYYSQIALKPLHQAVARILSRIPQDFTWNQEKISDWVKENRQKGFETFWSIDLTSATDRFPATFQKKVVERLVGSEFAENWYNLMTQRDFDFGKTKYRYSTGQPMGAYSSWPVFALSHHAVVRAAAKRAGIDHPNYAIVGDDIVIQGDQLAEHYIAIMDQLGVPLSKTKSLTGNCLEFCKRLWDASNEITPLPGQLILSSLRDHRTITQLLEWADHRGVPQGLRNRLLALVSKDLSPHKQEQVVLALTVPGKELPGCDIGALPLARKRWPILSQEQFNTVYREVKMEYLHRDLDRLSLLIANWASPIATKKLEGVSGLSADVAEFYPTKRVVWDLLPELSSKAWWSLDQFSDDLTVFTTNPFPSVRIFDPQALVPDRKKLKLREMSLLSEVHQRLLSKANQTPVVKPVFDPIDAKSKSLQGLAGMLFGLKRPKTPDDDGL